MSLLGRINDDERMRSRLNDWHFPREHTGFRILYDQLLESYQIWRVLMLIITLKETHILKHSLAC